MPDQYLAVQPPFPPHQFRRALKRAGIALLFLFVLIIPALRRLRRRIWIWTVLRAASVAAGAWLLARFIYAAAGAGVLLLGVVLVLSGLAFRARPQTSSLDSIARQLHALVVLNGGSLLCAEGRKPVPHVHLLVSPNYVVALSKPLKTLLEIPFSNVRELSVRPVSQGDDHKSTRWSLDITWQSAALTTARFCYEGVFAEHLARVAETTLRSLWKKELPVLKA